MYMFMIIYLMFLNFFFWILFLMFLLFNLKILIEWNFYFLHSLKIEFIIFLDWMTLIFASTVTLITSIVILYSLNYMEGDYYLSRFIMLILIFMLSMILMILSPNLISILLGWDGLGLSSYCLVVYYQSKKSFNSSMVTILMNRIGDIMLLMSIGLFMKFGSWNFLFLNKINELFMLIIFIAAITKSAQIPFSSWLPLAMAAPTPISSLVHSSTLVTAGVYLLIRFNFLFNKKLMFMFLILSCLTMFMSGLSANFEFDLKKIIALSTLSQLGLMILTLCLNYPKLTFFHLITHAMFKSLLFLCSGIMIHNCLDNQDIRFLSFLSMNMPLINLIFNVASFTLCGMPFLSGFYSKDLIVEMFLMNNFNWLLMFMMFMSMYMTISYTFRLIYYISLKNKKINFFYFYNSFNLMNYSIYILFLFSIFYGSILNWLMFSSLNLIFLPKMLKLLIYLFLLGGLILGLILPYFIKLKFMFYKFNMILYKFFNFMWFLSIMLKKNKINILVLSNIYIMNMDNSWLELITFKMKNYLIFLLINKKNNLILFFFLMMIPYFLMIFLI
uniref:NADH-ubiquinone oxidoreductase chain 5 n=1 Tax=Habrobracon hebetor TaxID=69819 RepID=A0A7D5HMK6_9HYME|nr:NADH dehydrogenase subunit 5 [Habrobracon hebetor]